MEKMKYEKLDGSGERKLIRRIRDIVSSLGGQQLTLDDSAMLVKHPGPCTTWVTTDPCPFPNLVQRIGMGDYYHAGWLSIAKSISDLAAMGACPTGVTISVDFPVDLSISDFDRFFQGVIDCAASHQTSLVGGNIKEAHTWNRRHERVVPQAVSCAVGYTRTSQALLRGEPVPGDLLCIVDKNEFGGFWSGIASHLRKDDCASLPKDLIERARKMALIPRAMVKEGQALLEQAPPRFCMDNSDGLLASALDLVKEGNVDAHFNLHCDMFSSTVRKVAVACGCDCRLWALGWGSCHLLCAASEAAMSKAQTVLQELGSELIVVGEVTDGNGKVVVNNREISETTTSSMRGDQFNPDSFWRSGPKQYTEDMISKRLEEL